jgi:exodeoxyribonuclease-1
MRNKAKLSELIRSSEPFVYTSGKYPSEFEKTTVVTSLFTHTKRDAEVVFDLRYDPTKYAEMTVDELVTLWVSKEKNAERLPVKTIQLNRCPAVAPLGVLDETSQKNIKLSISEVLENFTKLKKVHKQLSDKLLKALDVLNKNQNYEEANKKLDVDARLYDGFFNNDDRKLMNKLTNSDASEISDIALKFSDKRLREMVPLYKARNYPNLMSDEEIKLYQKYRNEKLVGGKENSRLAKFFSELNELSQQNLDSNKTYLLEELKLFGESLIPSDLL